MAKDKDPVLDEKFFDNLFPKIYPIEYSIPLIKDFCKNKLMVGDRLLSAGKLLEAAISKCKGLERFDTVGKDFVDGSDAKSSSVRWSSNHKSYSANISDVSNKKGLLRCMVYERITDRFYYFLIPHAAYKHISSTSNIEIPFNHDGLPKRDAKFRNVNWWDFEVPDFDGILADVAAPVTNIKEEREKVKAEKALKSLKKKELAEQKKQERLARMAHRLLKKSLLNLDLSVSTKTDSIPTPSIPCTEVLDQPEILDPVGR